MWMIIVVLVAAALFYAYSIRDTIKVSTKPSCGSCPHAAVHEKID